MTDAVPNDLVPVHPDNVPSDLQPVTVNKPSLASSLASAEKTAMGSITPSSAWAAASDIYHHPEAALEQFGTGLGSGLIGTGVRAASRALGYPIPQAPEPTTPGEQAARRLGTVGAIGGDMYSMGPLEEGFASAGEALGLGRAAAEAAPAVEAATPSALGTIAKSAGKGLVIGAGGATANQYANTGHADLGTAIEGGLGGAVIGGAVPAAVEAATGLKDAGAAMAARRAAGEPMLPSPLKAYGETKAGELLTSPKSGQTVISPFLEHQTGSETNQAMIPFARPFTSDIAGQQNLAAKAHARVGLAQSQLSGDPEAEQTVGKALASEPIKVPEIAPLDTSAHLKDIAAAEDAAKKTAQDVAATHQNLVQHAVTPAELGSTVQKSLAQRVRDLEAQRAANTAPALAAYNEAKANAGPIDVSDIVQKLHDDPAVAGLDIPSINKVRSATKLVGSPVNDAEGEAPPVTEVQPHELETIRATLKAQQAEANRGAKLGVDGASNRARVYKDLLDNVDAKLNEATGGAHQKFLNKFASESEPLNNFYDHPADMRGIVQPRDYQRQYVAGEEGDSQPTKIPVGDMKFAESKPEKVLKDIVAPGDAGATKGQKLKVALPDQASRIATAHVAQSLSPEELGHFPTLKDVNNWFKGDKYHFLKQFDEPGGALEKVKALRAALESHDDAMSNHEVARKALSNLEKEHTTAQKVAAALGKKPVVTPDQATQDFQDALDKGDVKKLTALRERMRQNGGNALPAAKDALANSLSGAVKDLSDTIGEATKSGGKSIIKGAELHTAIKKTLAAANNRIDAMQQAKMITPEHAKAFKSVFDDLTSLRNGLGTADEIAPKKGIIDHLSGFVSLHVPGIPGGMFNHIRVYPLTQKYVTKALRDAFENPSDMVKLSKRLESAKTQAAKMAVIRKNAKATALFSALPILNSEMSSDENQ